MRLSTYLTTLVTSTIALVYAQTTGIAFTQPTEGTVWSVGSSQTVTWSTANTSELIESIELRNGPSSNLQLVQVITADSIEVGSGQYLWNIADNLPTGEDYALIAKTSTSEYYSSRFKIEAAVHEENPSSLGTS
ncbi:Ser-Thr-rich glycosyl-phosphatidyl-inositol-anchored membrane family-domain-containing protein [Choanephora cucurbitarum]|nr:Ser-Thr-rich glycosyl-phosphatidyl-inositol-anchored membrane family-domain-containing protein [Choanephora cucurbitarum]